MMTAVTAGIRNAGTADITRHIPFAATVCLMSAHTWFRQHLPAGGKAVVAVAVFRVDAGIPGFQSGFPFPVPVCDPILGLFRGGAHRDI
jgi:hypothetical protein